MVTTKPLLAVALTSSLQEVETAQVWTLHPDGTWKKGYIVNFFGEATEVALDKEMRQSLTKRTHTYAFPIGVDPNRHPIYRQERVSLELLALRHEVRLANYRLHQLDLGGEAGYEIDSALNEIETLLQDAIAWIPEIK